MTIDISTAPSVQVTGIVRAPIDKVWALFRPFGDLMKWWPIYSWVKIDPPGTDEVGAIRSFSTKTGHGYREKLVERDDARHVERYDFVSTDMPVSISAIATTVAMTAVAGDHTQVTWSSWTEGGGMLRATILSTQQETYRDAIADLDRYFNPALGKLTVELVHATGLENGSPFPVDAYVLVQLDDAPPVRSKTRRFTKSPVFGETFELPVLSQNGKLAFSVFDSDLGRDQLLGQASVDLHTLVNHRKSLQTLPLTAGRGGNLSVGLRLELEAGEALPATEEQSELAQFAVLRGIFQKASAKAVALAQQITAGPEKTYAYARYPRSPQIPDVPLEQLPRMVAGLPPEEALSPHKLGRILERGIEYLYSQATFPARVKADPSDPYRAYLGGYLPTAEYVIGHVNDDTELARQFIQGVGPMVIKRVTAASEVPASMLGLSPGGRSIDALIAQKSLFLLDYEALAPLRRYTNMFFYAPLVLVYKRPDATGENVLDLAAIQLTRNASGNAVYTRETTPPNRWRFAKMHVACADNQYHQWLFHLGYSHLAVEPFAIAAHNALPADHPIAKLLAPHFRDTIGINFLARETLVSDIAPFTDRTFATGTAQALEMFLGAWKKYDFFAQSFPEELARRGFDEAKSDGLDGYFFREDGFLVWNAIGAYVRDVVAHFYADDSAVAADPALIAWAKESTDPERADIPGFPTAFTDRALLSRTLQTLIWATSAQHSAVNFPQFDYLSYVPNRPDSLFRAMPDGDAEIEAAYLASALPSPIISNFQISFAWVLTLPSEHALTTLDTYTEIHPLRTSLAEISVRLRARNDALVKAGKQPYPYLVPENIASSVAI